MTVIHIIMTPQYLNKNQVTMHSIGLYSFIYRPTRISNHSFTLIDNVFTNVTNHKVTSGILVSDITDHLPIFVF